LGRLIINGFEGDIMAGIIFFRTKTFSSDKILFILEHSLIFKNDESPIVGYDEEQPVI